LITLAELANLRVTVRTGYDPRSQGLGSRRIRLGRELRFRCAEILGWVNLFEEADAQCHSERRDET
jgi:hypothetical protein